jgi:diguanylate cyclase
MDAQNHGGTPPMEAPGAVRADDGSTHSRYLLSLPRRTWPLRTLGMGLGGLATLAVLAELRASWPAWAWAVFACFAWPHVALLLALRARDPFKAELRNFVLDSAFAGSLVPLMHFNLLPSVVLLSVVLADKLNTGVRGLLLRSLPGMVGAIVLVGVFTGFAWQPASSLLVVAASLPILVIHTLAVAASSYRLVRKVQRQNVQLETLSRTDALTGVASRGHWEALAGALLGAVAPGRPASLLIFDVDEFKAINDGHGHVLGDDVLRAIGAVLLSHGVSGGIAGRLGGDEFALAVPVDAAAAKALAARLREQVRALRFASAPALRCSVTIGVAAAPAGEGLRGWLEAADAALYRGKGHARRVATPDVDTSEA